jgi:hypothetical protein
LSKLGLYLLHAVALFTAVHLFYGAAARHDREGALLPSRVAAAAAAMALPPSQENVKYQGTGDESALL